MKPDYVNPLQWQPAVGIARQICADVFRDGGTPADALAAFGLATADGVTWSRAVDLIAEQLCLHQDRTAA